MLVQTNVLCSFSCKEILGWFLFSPTLIETSLFSVLTLVLLLNDKVVADDKYAGLVWLHC